MSVAVSSKSEQNDFRKLYHGTRHQTPPFCSLRPFSHINTSIASKRTRPPNFLNGKFSLERSTSTWRTEHRSHSATSFLSRIRGTEIYRSEWEKRSCNIKTSNKKSFTPIVTEFFQKTTCLRTAYTKKTMWLSAWIPGKWMFFSNDFWKLLYTSCLNFESQNRRWSYAPRLPRSWENRIFLENPYILSWSFFVLIWCQKLIILFSNSKLQTLLISCNLFLSEKMFKKFTEMNYDNIIGKILPYL